MYLSGIANFDAWIPDFKTKSIMDLNWELHVFDLLIDRVNWQNHRNGDLEG